MLKILLFSLLEVLLLLVPVLISVAIITIVERKVLAYTQRRVGPNTVGYYGILQPFADALKLILKENLIPQHVNKFLFFISPCISLICAFLGWAVIPFGNGYIILDIPYGVLYSLAISSFSIYGIFLSGWASNNKFAFLGSLRATAQIVSYELILSSAILAIIFLNNSFDYIVIIESQKIIWNIVPLFPFLIIFIISTLAELNRTPIDLVEAESELVSGYFTEYSSVVFVFFFLAEYSSIVIISSLTSILFLGGYLIPEILSNSLFINLESIVLAIKTCIFCFIIVWVRATLPRYRYDQLIINIWVGLLPITIALLILEPSILLSFNINFLDL